MTPQPTTLQPTTTLAPTSYTVPKPSNAPSLAPTQSPLNSLTRLDLITIMDRSDSMNWWSDECTAVIEAGGVQLPQVTNCWQLWVLFVERLVATLFAQNPALHWTDATGDSFRLGMYGFWCSNDQTVPQGEEIMVLSGSYDDYQLGIRTALAMLPNGGTCPGMIIETVLSKVQASNPRAFPYASTIVMTDGVFYDGNRPVTASEALRQACVNTFAVGIAITKPGPGDHPGTTGLTPAEIVSQGQQMLSLAGNASRVYVLIQSEPVPNPWAQLFDLLEDMSRDILALSAVPLGQLACSMTTPECAFGSQVLCTGQPYQAHFCSWNSNKDKCVASSPPSATPVPESQCAGITQTQCAATTGCNYVQGACHAISWCGFIDATSCGGNPSWCWWDVANLMCRSYSEPVYV